MNGDFQMPESDGRHQQNRLVDAHDESPVAEFETLLSRLSEVGEDRDGEDRWPHDQLDMMRDGGVLGWVIPAAFGGTELSATELTYGYEHLSAACLAATFVLTQRNGACQRIASSENEDLRSELLPKLCAGELFATVGVSHLTTSRQHLGQPAVGVRETDRGFVMSGTVPWVTGASQADYVVTGGTLEDGREILVAVAANVPGVTVHQPPRLLALNSTETGAMGLDDVEIESRYLIAGPVAGVMKKGQGGGTGSLTTSSLAIGAAWGSLRRLTQESQKRLDLVEICEPLDEERRRISDDMYWLLSGDDAAPGIESIRQRANSLVLRCAQAYLAASKGAGFVSGHPAERAVREAMFFLVWSCPQPVLTAALREFACVLES